MPQSLPLPLSQVAMMELASVSALPEECLLQPGRTCLGCFIETRDATSSDPSNPPIRGPAQEPGLGVRLGEVGGREEFGDACPTSDISSISIQCLSHVRGAAAHYGDQLLSDQLLSFPLPKGPGGDGKVGDEGEERTPEDSDDPEDEASVKHLYEGLLLDKVSSEEVLLANTGQDWGYFESFISESKMELLDLCSKNELSVNLFSEEDVDNLFDDEDDDSTLSSDVCSLKIRYESFQDNMREKTNGLQEETQFNFFPSVLAGCAKKEQADGVLRRARAADDLQPKAEELRLRVEEDKGKLGGDRSRGSPLDGTQSSPMASPKINYLLDFRNTEDSGEYSDDSSCTGSFTDSLQEPRQRRGCHHTCGPNNPLNYGLRSTRKVRYSDDYLYDVDSIESERSGEKKERVPVGQREEEDVDWCPKKRRKSSRKEPPVVIKYIIINRFKGERYMSVKLGRLDPPDATVRLSADAVSRYQALAPLKDFWQERRREREEQLRVVATDKHLNGRHHRPFSSAHPKRKYKIANRLRVQRVHTVEQSGSAQGCRLPDPVQEGGAREDMQASAPGGGTTAGLQVASQLNMITYPSATLKSRSAEREEREGRRLGGGSETVRIRKFKSEARLRIKKIREGGEGVGAVTGEADTCAEPTAAKASGETDVGSAALGPHIPHFPTNTVGEKLPYVSSTCSPGKPPTSSSAEGVEGGVAVIPGGYLQTLLDATDSSAGAGISYFSQKPTRQPYPLGLCLEEKQFSSSLQLAQSCVLSPPSESELQQSPQSCPSFPDVWHPQLCPSHSQDFAPESLDARLLPGSFPTGLPTSNDLTMSSYSQLGREPERLLYDKSYLSEPGQPPPEANLQACKEPQGIQYQRSSLCSDGSRLVSYDSAGSPSAASPGSYTRNLKSCERQSVEEEEGRDGFLSHCSPKVLVQQSVDALTPLRESTDLLDISNFTPDKFRHSSLSELSPPETPNLSPQVVGQEVKMGGKPGEFQELAELGMDSSREVKWSCEAMQPQQEQSISGYIVEGGQYQLHSFSTEDMLGLDKKGVGDADFEQQPDEMLSGLKTIRSKRKGSSKQTAGGQGPKKGRAPRATKAEKVKVPRQNSRSTKKIKAMLEGKAAKSEVALANSSSSGDWSGAGWSESHSLVGGVGDDQGEFEEPSNILSNIVSGMAEVQRFMMASIEPLWDPVSEACIPPEANSLNLKTLKILAGTEPELKKKGGAGAGRGRKGGKNQAKFNPSHPIFPHLVLGCNMFDKPNFINTGPAHKKLYRHKTSAKFPRIDMLKGKRVERDPSKDRALMASFEKLR